MEQLNRIERQDDDVSLTDIGVGNNTRANPPNKYGDMRAVPRNTSGNSGFAGIVRNKSVPSEFSKKIKEEIKLPTDVYEERSSLVSYRSRYIVFKNYLIDIKTLAKKEERNYSGLLSVREYSKKLSNNNEEYKHIKN